MTVCSSTYYLLVLLLVLCQQVVSLLAGTKGNFLEENGSNHVDKGTRTSSNHGEHFYQFPMTAVANDHNFSRLKQQKLILSPFWIPKVRKIRTTGLKSRQGKLSSFQKLQKRLFLPSAGFWGLLACGQVTPVSDSTVTLSFLCTSQISFTSLS